jgi:regulator of sigma E protease
MIPFPALDGSRVLFSVVEGIRGRKMKIKTEMIIINTGFYVLLLLLIFITSKEIFNLF